MGMGKVKLIGNRVDLHTEAGLGAKSGEGVSR